MPCPKCLRRDSGSGDQVNSGTKKLTMLTFKITAFRPAYLPLRMSTTLFAFIILPMSAMGVGLLLKRLDEIVAKRDQLNPEKEIGESI